MGSLDRQIISQLQTDFPISPSPYAIIAERLGIEEKTLVQRVQELIGIGTIRRVGVSIDSRKMGFSSTLAAIRVPSSQVETACDFIDSCSEITHSYLRANGFNIWFTIIAESHTRVQEVIEQLRIYLNLDVSDVLDLPVKHLFKLDARFTPTK